eukprot:43816-Eustigmatos_ZCMA.PRE.1
MFHHYLLRQADETYLTVVNVKDYLQYIETNNRSRVKCWTNALSSDDLEKDEAEMKLSTGGPA